MKNEPAHVRNGILVFNSKVTQVLVNDEIDTVVLYKGCCTSVIVERVDGRSVVVVLVDHCLHSTAVLDSTTATIHRRQYTHDRSTLKIP
jgi:hypothetical protein